MLWQVVPEHLIFSLLFVSMFDICAKKWNHSIMNCSWVMENVWETWVFQTLQKGTTAFDTCAGPLSGVVSKHAQNHCLVWFWRMHRTVVCCYFWWALHSKEEICGQLEQVYVLCQHGKKKIWKVINTDIKKFKWLKNILYLACIYDNINFCKTLGVGNSCYQE